MKIDDKDLPKLKHLIKELRVDSSVFPEAVTEFFDKTSYQSEFKRLSGILIKLNVCDFKKTQLGDIILLPNENTFDFDIDLYVIEEIERERKEKLQIKKTEIDLELAEKMLEEYPKTKWFARIGFLIAVVLVLKELIQWIIQLQSQ